MDNKININEAAHRVADFHLLSRLSHKTSIDGNYQAYYHEDRLYSVKNMKSGIVSLVYANSPHDAIRRCKEHIEGAWLRMTTQEAIKRMVPTLCRSFRNLLK